MISVRARIWILVRLKTPRPPLRRRLPRSRNSRRSLRVPRNSTIDRSSNSYLARRARRPQQARRAQVSFKRAPVVNRKLLPTRRSCRAPNPTSSLPICITDNSTRARADHPRRRPRSNRRPPPSTRRASSACGGSCPRTRSARA